MTGTSGVPQLIMSHLVLADLELALEAVLPDGHVLGDGVPHGVSDTPGGSRCVGLRLAPETAAQVVAAGALALLDQEQTPLARLHVLDARADGDDVVVSGDLARERRRESGTGRDLALDLGPAREGSDLVVVLCRPVLEAEADAVVAALPAPPSGDSRTGPPTVAILVPDDALDTSGVPTHQMTRLATHLATRVTERAGARVVVATVPFGRRGSASDLALADRLTAHLRARALHLISDDPEVDPAAGAWSTALAALPAPGIPPGLAADDLAVLRTWRRPRARSGLVVMFTGLSGSGKSTIARAIGRRIERAGRTVTLLDGDVVRQMLSSGLGFDRTGRTLNIRRIGFVAAEIARHGGIAICAPVAPYADGRVEARRQAEAAGGDFVLVHVSTPIEECERRDLKGLYAKARQGLIPEFTGVSDPYEIPRDADLTIDTAQTPADVAAESVMALLATGGWIEETS